MRLRLALILFALTAILGSAPTQAQEPAADILFSRFRHFRIPYQIGASEQRLKQLQLFVSTDHGQSWQPSATAAPDQQYFRFICEKDALYWFCVQTQDMEGRLFPLTLQGAKPSLKVLVDTQAPQVQLRPLPARDGKVGVIWDTRDDYLDVTSTDALRLEYRAHPQLPWAPLPVGPAASQYSWTPEGNGNIEVRLKARDRAGNIGEATTTVSVQGGAFAPNPGPETQGDVPQAPLDPHRQMVNSKRISLNYELKDVGPSGVSVVELWYTVDGRSWNRFPLPQAEDGGNMRPLVFEVNNEGVYGFTLVAKSGVGLSEKPPQVGERPQVWVEVDLTKPLVELQQVVVGQGVDQGKVSIQWSARDKNLKHRPITLSYSEQLTGPWTPIAQHLDNNGMHVWKLPEKVPYQFHVRVEAFDRAGNIGEAMTSSLVKVDLAKPKVKILEVQPAGGK